MYEKAGNIVQAHKHMREAVELGISGADGVLLKPLLLQYADFCKRHGHPLNLNQYSEKLNDLISIEQD